MAEPKVLWATNDDSYRVVDAGGPRLSHRRRVTGTDEWKHVGFTMDALDTGIIRSLAAERDTARADRQALVEETRRKALEDAARTVCHNCASRGFAQHIEGMGFYHTGISIQEDGWCRGEKILRLLAQRPAEGGGKGVDGG